MGMLDVEKTVYENLRGLPIVSHHHVRKANEVMQGDQAGWNSVVETLQESVIRCNFIVSICFLLSGHPSPETPLFAKPDGNLREVHAFVAARSTRSSRA